MAAALLQKLDDLTECSICCDAYKDPRQLPCLHSFCFKCLQGYVGKIMLKSGVWVRILCPLCRKETKLPHDGIQGLPKNFFMEKIMELKRLSGPVTTAKRCDVCMEDEENSASPTDVPVAEMYCVDCHYNLCTGCTKEHKRHMKNHCIVEFGCERVMEKLVKTFATSYCSSHPQDTVRMFCLDCNAVICFVCFAEEHQTHKCSDINKEAEIMRKQIESDIKGVSSRLSEFQQIMPNMDEHKSNFLQQIELVAKDVARRSNHLKEIIDKDTKTLLTELESIKSSQLKEMCTKTEELDRCVTILNSFITYGEEIVALGSASDVCHSYKRFHIRYDEIIGNFKDPPFPEFSPKRVTLKTTAMDAFGQKNLIGRIEDLSSKDEDHNGDWRIEDNSPAVYRGIANDRHMPTGDWMLAKCGPPNDWVIAKNRPADDWGIAKDRPTDDWGIAKDRPTDDWGIAKDKPTDDWGIAKDRPTDDWGIAKDRPTDDWGIAKDRPTDDWGIAKDGPTDDWGIAKDKPTDDWEIAKDRPADDWGYAGNRDAVHKEESILDQDDGWHRCTYFTPGDRKKRSEMNLEDKFKKKDEKKCQKGHKKKYNRS